MTTAPTMTAPTISATNTLAQNFAILLSDQYHQTTIRSLSAQARSLRRQNAVQSLENAWANFDHDTFLMDLDALAVRHAVQNCTVHFKADVPIEFPGRGLTYNPDVCQELRAHYCTHFREHLLRFSPERRHGTALYVAIKGFLADYTDKVDSVRNDDGFDTLAGYRAQMVNNGLARLIVKVCEVGFENQLLPSSIFRRVLWGATKALNEEVDASDEVREEVLLEVCVLACEMAMASWRIGGTHGQWRVEDEMVEDAADDEVEEGFEEDED
jgi:hypothetical protein